MPHRHLHWTLVGPGGYELKLSLGSVQHVLVDSSAGHLMLPCSRFDVPMKPRDEVTSFIVGDYFDGSPARSSCKSCTQNAQPTWALVSTRLQLA